MPTIDLLTLFHIDALAVINRSFRDPRLYQAWRLLTPFDKHLHRLNSEDITKSNTLENTDSKIYPYCNP